MISHGIYDVAQNAAAVHLNTSRDTTEFACASIELWWNEQARMNYPQADALLVLCDGGGSHSSSAYSFKKDLQALSPRLGLLIRIARDPPYCSKYNPSSIDCSRTSRVPAQACRWRPSKRSGTTWKRPKQPRG